MSRPTAVGVALVSAGHPLVLASSLPAATPRHRPDDVVSEPFTREMVRRYQRWLGVQHPAAGASCATQHYAGRAASWLVGCWVLTGGLPSLDDCLVEVDIHGRTQHLVVPEVIEPTPARPLDVVAALQEHMAPMLATACQIGRITPRLAWGGVATSVAGAVLRSVEGLDEESRTRVLADAATMLAEDAWPVPRPLVTLSGAQQRRHTCCLIHLSTEHRRCTTCPHHVPEH